MKPSAELLPLVIITLITSCMWIPYVLARIHTLGLRATFGNPGPSSLQTPAWAARAKRAHSNAIENLAVFAPLVLAAAILGVSTAATLFASKLFLGARVVHFVVYVMGLPVIRTLAFLAGTAATLIFALTLLGQVT